MYREGGANALTLLSVTAGRATFGAVATVTTAAASVATLGSPLLVCKRVRLKTQTWVYLCTRVSF